jgi:acyl-CoA synthetase (AMP-forming)/AMP-acid ligase II
MLVPVQYQRSWPLADFAATTSASFRMKFSTSAPFAAALKADVLARWPGGLIEYYGMTEGGGTGVLFAHEHPDKLHTVGARPGPRHPLIDEDGTRAARGRRGEVVGASRAMMTGYHNRPERPPSANGSTRAASASSAPATSAASTTTASSCCSIAART